VPSIVGAASASVAAAAAIHPFTGIETQDGAW